LNRHLFNAWNFAAYQVAWFAVLIGAANGHGLAGAGVALFVTVAHVWMRRDVVEIKLVGAALLLGVLVDGALAMSGQVRFSDAWPSGFAPYWMLALWMAFATTLNHSLRWLMTRPLAAALAGAVGGPLAYFAGDKLGALSLAHPVALPLIALLWTPAMVALSMLIMRAAVVPAPGRLAA
jgi:hypothetical protein